MDKFINCLSGITGALVSAHLLEGILPPAASNPSTFELWLDFFTGVFEFTLYYTFAPTVAFYLNSFLPSQGIEAMGTIVLGPFFMPQGMKKLQNFFYSIPYLISDSSQNTNASPSTS